MKTLAIAFCAALAAAPALAQEHLVPEGSPIGATEMSPQYDAMLRAVLADAYGEHVVERVIVAPADSPEAAVALEHHGERFRILSLQADTQLWSYERLNQMRGDGTPSDSWTKLERSLPRDWRDVKVARYTADLDAPLGQRIIALWTAMLYETRYDPPGETYRVVSGTTFHFSGLGAWLYVAGQTEAPPQGSAPAMLVDIAAAMDDYARAPDATNYDVLERRVSLLERRLRL